MKSYGDNKVFLRFFYLKAQLFVDCFYKLWYNIANAKKGDKMIRGNFAAINNIATKGKNHDNKGIIGYDLISKNALGKVVEWIYIPIRGELSPMTTVNLLLAAHCMAFGVSSLKEGFTIKNVSFNGKPVIGAQKNNHIPVIYGFLLDCSEIDEEEYKKKKRVM
jgi:ABC-type polysaccharide/polyol phosphate transport system ATPase subunit